MKKTKRFEEFVKMEIGLDLTNSKDKSTTNTLDINESNNLDGLKKAAQIMGLDLTKNLSKRIDLI